MNTYVPFVYLVTFKPTGQYYYGARYAELAKPPAHPSQLGTTYFSSSEYVKNLMKEHGVDAFTYEVRKTFQTQKETRRYETRFLTKVNAAKNPKFLNKHNAGCSKNYENNEEARKKISKKLTGKKKSKEHLEKIAQKVLNRTDIERANISTKISEATKGKKKPPKSAESIAKAASKNTGKKRTQESKDKMSAACKGKKKSKTHKEAMSVAAKNKGPITEEHRNNLSRAHINKQHTPETRAKMVLSWQIRKANKLQTSSWSILSVF